MTDTPGEAAATGATSLYDQHRTHATTATKARM